MSKIELKIDSDGVVGIDGSIVNGKLDMGFRKLVVSHVENATTLYAYTEDTQDQLEVIHRQVQAAVEKAGEAADPEALKADQQVAAHVSLDGGSKGNKRTWVRATIEQKGLGPRLKVKALDIGATYLVEPQHCRPLPDSVTREKLSVVCLKYKMADLKPKGRDDGFSARDREAGADWLRSVIGGRTVKAKCHKVVNYKGGIMFDGEVNGHNLNLLALKQGFAKPNPEVFGFHAAAMNPMMPVGHGLPHHGPRPNTQMNAFASYDKDYIDYQQNFGGNKGGGNKKGANNAGGGQAQQKGGKTPAQQRLRQPNMAANAVNNGGNANNNGNNGDPVQKLKSTVLQLESTLSKRNKEIAALKKGEGGKGGQSVPDYPDLAKAVESARAKNKGQDTAHRVAAIVSQVQEAAATLKVLENEKLVEAERSTVMLAKCQDEVGKLVGKHAKKSPLHKSLNNAKDSVRKYVGEYLKLMQELDLVCSALQTILETDPLIPRPVIHTVDITDRSKRIEIIETAVETANAWVEAQDKDSHLDKSNSELESLCHGLEQMAESLRRLNRGESLEEPLPDVSGMVKTVSSQYGVETKAAKAKKGGGDDDIGKVMTGLAKAIHVCIHVKELLEKNLPRYNEVYDIAVSVN